MSAHLGHAVTAFVDGELDHERRDEVLAHLAWCGSCASEVDALRGLKAALRQTGGPALPFDLSARLMASIPTAAIASPVLVTGRPAHRRLQVRTPLHGHPRLRRTAVGGAFVALGLGGALSLAGPPPRQPAAPVDPTNVAFIRDHTSTSREVPLTDVDVQTVSTRSSR